MLRRLDEIRLDDPEATKDFGGKAIGLGRLAAAGLRVPPTWILPARARAAPPAEVAAALDAAFATLVALGPAIIVRSSASCEDDPAAAAPGLFASVAGVRTRAALDHAVRAVWASLDGEIARAYLARRGIDAASAAMAVVLQPELQGRAATVYTRRPGAADELILEVGATPVLLARAGDGSEAAPLTPLPPGLSAAAALGLARAALAAERAIAAGSAGADVELVLDDGGEVWLVQARAVVAAPTIRSRVAKSYDFSAREPEVIWRWDAAHNPEPLSPAQASLVALVDAAGVAPYRQRVVDGYLYYAERAGAPAEAADPAGLRRVYEDAWRPALEAALARAEASPPPALAEVLAAYLEFYAGYARLARPVRQARDALVAWLARHVGERAPREAARLLGATGATHPPARLPLAWDVAAAELTLPPAPAPRPATPAASATAIAAEAEVPADLLQAARDAAAIAEEDDALFARAQAAVRRALAALAARWQVPITDLLHVPLAELRDADAPPADLHRRAEAARAERAVQRTLVPPFAIASGRGLPSLGGRVAGGPGVADDGLLRGVGSGGRARGRVHRLDFEAEGAVQAVEIAAPPGSVVVASTVLPGMAVLVDGAVAIVAEHGGPLGHGAALARELGLPCVVGCAGALAQLSDGDEVLVDGAAGLVWKL
jgi:phosphohistidine swiveling domain-containing protein